MLLGSATLTLVLVSHTSILRLAKMTPPKSVQSPWTCPTPYITLRLLATPVFPKHTTAAAHWRHPCSAPSTTADPRPMSPPGLDYTLALRRVQGAVSLTTRKNSVPTARLRTTRHSTLATSQIRQPPEHCNIRRIPRRPRKIQGGDVGSTGAADAVSRRVAIIIGI
jgi:hypothetical protein